MEKNFEIKSESGLKLSVRETPQGKIEFLIEGATSENIINDKGLKFSIRKKDALLIAKGLSEIIIDSFYRTIEEISKKIKD